MGDGGQRSQSQTIWVGIWVCSVLAVTLNQLVCFLRSVASSVEGMMKSLLQWGAAGMVCG